MTPDDQQRLNQLGAATLRRCLIDEPAERGAASVLLDLTGGVITATHGTDHVVLRQWTAREGDWERIWDALTDIEHRARGLQ